MECDTFSSIPDAACNALWINELMFSQLRSFVGPVFTGGASQAFGTGDVDWGRAIQLSENETLEMRIFPRGVLSSGKLLEMRNMIIMMAARRRGPVGKDHVTFAILWHPEQDIDLRFSSFDNQTHTMQSVSARNLHIVCPSLFNHHDAQAATGAAQVQPWPVLDPSFFHSVRPSTYSIHRMIKLPGGTGQVLKTVTAAPGVSQFVIGGHIAGVEIQDEVRPSTMQLKHADWAKLVEGYTHVVQDKSGFEKGLSAMHSAMAICDLLTGEGLLGILGHNFTGGVLPDMFHSPGGFPLLIAFMTRVACYPQRYRLTEGTPADQQANRELISMFEASWAPVHPEKAGGRNIYAIDIAIRQAHTEARVAAKKSQQTDAPVEDNMTFWHRAGQRCVTALFGPQLEDFLPVHSSFGLSHKVVDPLVAARNAALQKQMQATEAVTGTDGRVSVHVASVQEKRTVLLMVLNSVEHWLRTGMYCGMQLHQKRKPQETVGMRLFRPGGGKNNLDRKSLRLALDRGMEASVREAVESGEAKTEEQARISAKLLRDGIENALNFDTDGEIDLNDLKLHMPKEVIDASIPTLKERASKHCGNDPSDPLKGVVLTEYDISEGAFEHATNCISSSMCQGPMVHHDFSMGCFLSSPHAVNTCADCDAEVHVLSAAFLSTRYGSCARCQRPRCIPCTTLMHSRGKPTALSPNDISRPCKRCRPSTKADKKVEKVADALGHSVDEALVACGLQMQTGLPRSARQHDGPDKVFVGTASRPKPRLDSKPPKKR